MFGKIKILWQCMEGRRRRYALAIAALVVGTFVAMLIPLVLGAALDGVIVGAGDPAPTAFAGWLESIGLGPAMAWMVALSAGQKLGLAAGVVFVLASLNGLFIFTRSYLSAESAETISRRMRNRLYDHLQHLPAAYHSQADTGDLVQRCSSDLETMRLFLAAQAVEIARPIAMLIIVIPIMLSLDVRMTWVSLAVFPVIICFSIFFFLRIKQSHKVAQEAEGRMTTVLQENLTGIRVVRAFARQEFEREKFARENGEYRRRTYRLIQLNAYYWSSSDFMCMGQTGLTLVVGAHLAIRGEISLGTLYEFLHYVGMLIWPLRQMGRVLTGLGQTVVSLDRMREILDEPLEEGMMPAPGVEPVPDFKGHIQFRDIEFSYEPEKPVLRDLSFEIQPGQTLAILGHTGSGKSTLVHLLARLYDYQKGSITIDGHELKTLARKRLRSQIGMALQEPFLYSKTVGDNIRLGLRGASDSAVKEAALVACVHDSIQAFEQGYETKVGELGVTLSGGQRQRVALARAILKDPPILILDDSLSAVDTQTESMILDAMRSRHGRRTTIVIAHRLSTLMQADKILVLDHGKVSQSGSHEELVNGDGLYQSLWKIQSDLREDLVNA